MAELKAQLIRNSSIGAISVASDGDDPSSRLPSSRWSGREAFAVSPRSPSSPGRKLRPASSQPRTSPAMKISQSSPEMRQRPGTAVGTNAAGEARGLRGTKSFAGPERTLEHGGYRTTALPTVREDDAPAGLFLSRGGLRRPRSACIFATAQRPGLVLGEGATVPFHFSPKPLLDRDPTTDVKNAPKVPFTVSTRDQWQRVHMSAASTAAAGPGAYDPNVDMMSTKRIFPTLSFTTARREVTIPKEGPGPYAVNFVEKHVPQLPFAASKRPGSAATIATPGPADIRFIERHVYAYRFSTAPGHDIKSGDAATAAVPLRGGERARKHKPIYKFSTAPRFAAF